MQTKQFPESRIQLNNFNLIKIEFVIQTFHCGQLFIYTVFYVPVHVYMLLVPIYKVSKNLTI